MLRDVAVADLRPNPFRRLDQYPIRREKVEALKESGITRAQINVRELTNEQMLKMMARENMQEWGTSAGIELETIRAVIDAFGKGEIDLLPVPKKTPADAIRHVGGNSSKTYTKTTVARFLGWVDKRGNGDRPNEACDVAFAALDMIGRGLLEEADIEGLRRSQVKAIIDRQRRIHEAESCVAEVNRLDAERARGKAAEATTPGERYVYGKQAEILAGQAGRHAATELRRSIGVLVDRLGRIANAKWLCEAAQASSAHRADTREDEAGEPRALGGTVAGDGDDRR
jgi:hypothetical protein